MQRYKKLGMACKILVCVCVLSRQANGHANRIENIKPMFVEPKGKSNFTEVSVLVFNI